MYILTKGIKVIILLLLAVSCTPQKKLHKLLKKHPELVSKDTLKVKDTVFIDHIYTDTVLSWHNLYDTVTIEKERLKMKIVRVNDSIYLSGECLADTIYTEKIVLVDKINYTPPLKNRNIWLIFAIIIGIIVSIRLIR
jgi:hypothetical protein